MSRQQERRASEQGGGWFVVAGDVDGRPTLARWGDGHLAADRDLRQRIDVVVALGETAVAGDGARVRASLDGPPLGALVAVLRAMTVVRSVALSPALQAGASVDSVATSLDSGS